MSEVAGHDRHRLSKAARLLFPAEEVAAPGFWTGLDPTRLKQAFRKEVRRWHPDAPRPLPGWTVAARQARFVALKQAYDLLRDYLRQNSIPCGPRVIAVAGAKGGVGASVIAANLGVLLARAGRRVILADLDPTGSTLPFYLGNLPGHRVKTADTVVARGRHLEQSPYGPTLLTGVDPPLTGSDGSEHGQLLADLQDLEADDILCDLGSAPASGSLDLFLAAQRHLVVTTCEPAAYVKTYAFLKRLRQRLSPANRSYNDYLPTSELRPLVLFNQVTHRDRPGDMGRRLQEVAARSLGLRISFLSLPYREEIAQSVRELVPVACRGTDPVSRHLSALCQVFLP